ncbi:phage portal protein [Tsuneonella sp. HG222]
MDRGAASGMKWWKGLLGLERDGAKATSLEALTRWGGASVSDRDNFTTNRVTLAEYNDAYAGAGNAVGLSATYACTNLIAGSAASLSCAVMRPDGNGVRQEARDHPLHQIVSMDPNFDQTDFDFWEFVFACVELQGNAYAEIVRNGAGSVAALLPVRPDTMRTARVAGGEIEYRWVDDGVRKVRRQSEMFHVRGFGGGPLSGLSTLSVCRLAFGGALAAERAAANMFANGARPSGVLSMPGGEKLTAEQRAEVETLLQEKFVGSINAGRPMLLDNGLTWQALSINPEDAQMLESRKFSGEEICRIFGVPPAMVGYGDKSSNWGTGKEVDVLGFLKFTLRKRLKRVEKSATKQLLTRQERQSGLAVKFNLEDLLRGDSAGRAAFYQIMVRLGVMTRNEARRLENLPPIPGGDEAFVQMQDVPLSTALAEEKPA